MNIEAFFDPHTFTLTYVVSDPATRDALVIDPVLDYDPIGSLVSSESIDRVSEFLRRWGAGRCGRRRGWTASRATSWGW